MILVFLLSGGRLQKHGRERKEVRKHELGDMIKRFEKNVGRNIFNKKPAELQPVKKSKVIRINEEVKQIDKADVLSRIKNQGTEQPLYSPYIALKKKETLPEQKSEIDLIEEAVEETKKKIKIDTAMEQTRKRNKERKTAEEIIDELKNKDNKGQKDEDYYNSLFKE